ncbi:MAG: diaminopimelate epimerase [Clostridia bacterium]|nr:diaminopimelate epimerase [Clostridia bacterium]
MNQQFTKMHGCGNDYLFFNCLENEIESPDILARKLSPRRFSVGADGIVLICKSNVADAKMRMFNADGSEGEMCGNAIRCVGKYLYERGFTDKRTLQIETLAGIKELKLNMQDGRVESVRVDMGRADFSPDAVGLASDTEYVDRMIDVNGTGYKLTALSTGNPHAIVYTSDPKTLKLDKLGPMLEKHPIFKNRINAGFVHIINESELEMRVWERGSGETLACGTLACAAVAASVKNGRLKPGIGVNVHLPGGTLTVECDPDFRIHMTGPAEFVYDATADTDIM